MVLLTAINHRDIEQISKYLYNDLERVVLPHHPQVLALKEQFEQCSCRGTLMSGSGPTVFALSDSLEAAQLLQTKMQTAVADQDLDLWVTKFCTSGIRLN